MNKILFLILASIVTFGFSNGQDIQNYIMPGELFNNLNKETQEKIISLNKEMKKGGDPSFESVSSIFPDYMNYPKAIVGVKEHLGRFLSSWDGAIISPPMYISFEVNISRSDLLRIQSPTQSPTPFESIEVKKLGHSLLDNYLPVIIRTFEYNGLIYEQTLFAYSEGFSTENALIAFVRMKVKNPSGQKKNSTLSIRFRETGVISSEQIWSTCGIEIIDCPGKFYLEDNMILNENGDVIFWSESQGKFHNNKFSYELSLEPDEEKDIHFCIPYLAIKKSTNSGRLVRFFHDASLLSKVYFDNTLDKVKIYWKEVLASGMQIDVPEKIVNNAYKTWRINNFLLVQEYKLHQSYKTTDAPFFYEGIFGYAAAMYLNTITTGGYFEEAKKCARMFIKLQRPDGGISGVNIDNDIIPHQHGAILYTISQIYRMERDDEWFKDIIPDIIKACDWIIKERSKNKTLADGEKPLTYGMLPAFRYNVDFGHSQEYVGNSWCWAGLNQVAIALSELGKEYEKESIRLKNEADEYRADIFASMGKAVIKQDNFLFLPMVMTNKDTIETYYNILSPRMLESEIFDTDDERLKWIPDFLERQSLILGIARFGGRHGYSAHFSAGYGITNIRLNRINKFLLTFYGMVSYGMARELYSTQEHDNFKTGHNIPWNAARQPHLHSTSELIRVTNQMLIKEEREEIWLAYGVPKKWLEDGKKIEVKKAQTCFGPFSYNIESFVSEGYIKTNISSSIRKSPYAVKLKLRHPQGKNISRVEVNGKVWKDFGKEIINLPGTGEEYSIVAYY